MLQSRLGRNETKPEQAVPQNLPWVEKYRPANIGEIAHQETTVQVLSTIVNTTNLPHMLFFGPPGTGKTSAILALSKQLFGPDMYRSRVLELNASDERGIQVVRDKVKKFAKVAVSKARNSEYPCPSYKIIILDEADSLTGDAQAALRRIIEQSSQVTRFCLVCNYISKIIDPLASRCMKFMFNPIGLEAHLGRLQYICEAEDINCTAEAFELLIKLADGDLRKSINTLQSTAKLFGNYITDEMVREVSGIIPMQVVEGIYGVMNGRFDDMDRAIDDAILNGYQPNVLIDQFYDFILEREEVQDAKKAATAELLAAADHELLKGGDEKLVLMKCFSGIQLAIR